MLFALLIAAACYAGYRYWNHRFPTDDAGRLRRAGSLATLAGIVTLPWMWWSGLPEAAIVAGVVAIVIGIRRRHTDHAHA